MDMILASLSPRRKEILLKNNYKFDIIPSLFDEKINGEVFSDVLAINCAFEKAKEVQTRIGQDKIIVSADTVVVLDDIILGKPVDTADAISMLMKLSNKTHFVATSICLLYKNKAINGIEKTYVTFRDLSKTDILNYINSSKPYDKAGSYGIQDEKFDFAINIDGNLDNVIGFPMKLFKELLAQI